MTDTELLNRLESFGDAEICYRKSTGETICFITDGLGRVRTPVLWDNENFGSDNPNIPKSLREAIAALHDNS